MGNLCCTNIYAMHPELEESRPLFEAFQLSLRDVHRLYKVFSTLDIDRSGLINIKELFYFLDAKESTKFCDRVFTLFDEDKSGQIDFREFVVALWNYCTLSHTSLIVFAFDLYDADETGELSMQEIDGMLKDLYGEQIANHAQAKQIRKELINIGGRFSVDKFRAFIRNHPALLFPAFQMQLALQHCVLGEHFWARCSAKRVRLSDGRRVMIEEVKSINTQHKPRSQIVISDPTKGQDDLLWDETTSTWFRPKQQMAQLILQTTGTLNYRRRGHLNGPSVKKLSFNPLDMFLGSQKNRNTQYIQAYADAKLKGMQPWHRHAQYDNEDSISINHRKKKNVGSLASASGDDGTVDAAAERNRSMSNSTHQSLSNSHHLPVSQSHSINSHSSAHEDHPHSGSLEEKKSLYLIPAASRSEDTQDEISFHSHSRYKLKGTPTTHHNQHHPSTHPHRVGIIEAEESGNFIEPKYIEDVDELSLGTDRESASSSSSSLHHVHHHSSHHGLHPKKAQHGQSLHSLPKQQHASGVKSPAQLSPRPTSLSPVSSSASPRSSSTSPRPTLLSPRPNLLSPRSVGH